MRNYHLIFVLFSFCFESYCQGIEKTESVSDTAKLKCVYTLTYQPDSTDAHTILSEKAFLLIGQKSSSFQTVNSFLSDSMADSPTNPSRVTHIINVSQYPVSRFQYIIYKQRDIITVIDNIYVDTYKYSENLPFTWSIRPETNQILGYNCQKAVTIFADRRYEAWFTKEIPTSEGPYKFHGLPGLIIKISDTKGHYRFELSSIKKISKRIEFPQKHFIPTNKAAFLKGLATYKANAIDIQAQHGSSYGDLATQKKLYQEKLKKRNNPLELK